MALSKTISKLASHQGNLASLIWHSIVNFRSDFLLILILGFAQPDENSLTLGSLIFTTGVVLGIWVCGYESGQNYRPLIGPYRYVRLPQHFILCLFAFGGSFAAKSLPGLIWSLGMMILSYQTSLYGNKTPKGLKDFPYQHQIPSIIPTLFPYSSDGFSSVHPHFRWQRVFVDVKKYIKLAFEWFYLWLCLFIFMKYQTTPVYQWLAASTWFLGRLTAFVLQNFAKKPSFLLK